MADSHIVYTEMVAERKTEESIPYGSKKHRGYTEKQLTPLRAYCVGVCLRVCLPLACVLRLTPLASGYAYPLCFGVILSASSLPPRLFYVALRLME